MGANGSGIQKALARLIQAIGHYRSAYTNFVEWAQQLLTHGADKEHLQDAPFERQEVIPQRQ